MDALVSQTLQRCMTELETSTCVQRGKNRLTVAIGLSLCFMVIIIVLMIVMIRKLNQFFSLQIGQ
jgi:hypothetical protein